MSRCSRRAVLAYVLVLVALLCAAPSTVSAAFTSSVPTATSSLTSDTSFPAYDAAVAGGGTAGTSPFAYYRSDEAASAATTSTAADSSTNGRAGTYPTPTDGPLLAWSFGDGAGTKAYDSSGAVNTGTLTGGAASTATGGHLGGAMSFAAASGSVAAPGGILNPDTAYTISTWLQVPTLPAGDQVALSLRGANQSALAVVYRTGCTCWRLRVTTADASGAGASDSSNNSPVVVAGTWTHVAVVHAGTNLLLHVNGALQATKAVPASWATSGSLTAGCLVTGTACNSSYRGLVDEVRAYPRALSASSVLNLYLDDPALLHDFEEAGGAPTDGSGNGNTGALVSGATRTASGKFGRALSLNGTSDYATAPSAALDQAQSFTVATWVYDTGPATASSSSSVYDNVVSKDGGANSPFFLQYRDDTSGTCVTGCWQFSFSSANTTSATYQFVLAPTTVAATQNTWVHLAGVYDRTANTIKIYVNGTLQASLTLTTGFVPWSTTGDYQIGAVPYGGGTYNFFPGRIDGLRFYQRALDASELAALAGGSFPATRPQEPLDARMTAAVPGALQGPVQGQRNSTALALQGSTSAPSQGYAQTATTGTASFTMECWLRTEGGSGGYVMGLASAPTGTSATATSDRLLFVDSGGNLTYGVKTSAGVYATLRSPAVVDDGQWHHVVGSFDGTSRSMDLYVDGRWVRTATLAAGVTNTAGSSWRWGGGPIATNWPNRPGNQYVTGTLDEVAVYTTHLSDQDIARHFWSNF